MLLQCQGTDSAVDLSTVVGNYQRANYLGVVSRRLAASGL